MTFNAPSQLRLLRRAVPKDKLPGMHSVPQSAVLPYAAGVMCIHVNVDTGIYVYIHVYMYIHIYVYTYVHICKYRFRNM